MNTDVSVLRDMQEVDSINEKKRIFLWKIEIGDPILEICLTTLKLRRVKK